jgi:hypothetical protein
MNKASETSLKETIEWLQDMKERFVDPESVDDGEELALEIVDKLPYYLEGLKRIQTREGME